MLSYSASLVLIEIDNRSISVLYCFDFSAPKVQNITAYPLGIGIVSFEKNKQAPKVRDKSYCDVLKKKKQKKAFIKNALKNN